MSELLILILIDILSVLVPPEVQEVVSEKLKLALQFFIVFAHRANILLQGLNISLFHFFEMEFENLDSELHLSVVVELDAIELILVDPSLELVDVLRIQVSLPLELILGH